MKRLRWVNWAAVTVTILASGGFSECQQAASPAHLFSAFGALQGPSPLLIENDSELPDTYPGANYQVQFHVKGGVPVFQWRLISGTLPRGLKLDDGGLLHGKPERAGEFQFTIAVKDGSRQPAVQKGFSIHVKSALTVIWKVPPHVGGNRIDGSVDVTNTTPDNMDLTFVVLAVAPNGRATAIGYQHFVLPRATIDKELPFGDTLPHDGYMVYADVVGEVAAKNLIYRTRLQTKQPLQVTVGP